MYYHITFKGIHTHNPQTAIDKYLEETGIEPSLILVQPAYPVKAEHPIMIRSRFGSGVMMLVTHEMALEEAMEKENDWKERNKDRAEVMKRLTVFTPGDPGRASPSIEVQQPRKPAKPKKPYCPHCGNLVHNFNNLAHWYGWEHGIEPDYWGELRLYVFRRDDFTCATCEGRYPANKLQAHHLKRKEDGGTDSARNLQTLCAECHKDNKPIFSGDDDG